MSRFALLLLPFFLLSCSEPRPLQFNLGVESVQLDWSQAIDSTSVMLLDNIMEGLTTYADSLQGGVELVRPLPALAASWSISEGGRVYRFYLKPGLRWSDGVELEAQHFVDSWQRLLAPENGSPNAYHLFEIENAQAFNEGKEKDFSRVGAKALDKHTLEVRLRRQVPYFLHLVAAPSTFPVRKDLIEAFGGQWMDPENLVTVGPYRITEWTPGDRVVLRANDSYHGPRPAIERVICLMAADPMAALAMYENNRLDILARDLPASFVRALQGRVDYRTGPKLSVSFLAFNTKRPPFDRVENRRAFIRAMDRNELAAYFQGTQTPTSGWIPPGLLGYREDLGIAAEGRESGLLKGRSVEIRYGGSDTWNLAFQAMQRQLAEKLKLHTKLTQLDGGEFNEFLASLSSSGRARAEALPHLFLVGWVADYPDPHSFMNVFTSTSESNYGEWHHPGYDRLVESAVSTGDENLRRQYYDQAQRLLLVEQAAVMPLFFSSHQALVRPGLMGVQLNVLDKWYFRNLSFESEGWGGFGRSFLRRLRGSRPGEAGAS